MSQSGVSSSNTATTDTSLSVGVNEESLLPSSSLLGSIISQQRYMSSTQASVDSESDYQTSCPANGLTAPGSQSASLSRSSSFSMLSTTAQKDGVQGRRRKFYDPYAYSAWVERMGSPAHGDDPTGGGDTTPEVEIPEDIEGCSDHGMTPDCVETSELGESRHTPELEHEHRGDQDQDLDMDHATSEHSWINDSPRRLPNIPTAPPVTLNEKIRLLRTGSVSGPNRLPDSYTMSDPYSRSEANSVGSEHDSSEINVV